MKVLLNDSLASEGTRVFEELGIKTDTRKRDLNSLIADIGQFDGLIVTKEQVADMMEFIAKSENESTDVHWRIESFRDKVLEETRDLRNEYHVSVDCDVDFETLVKEVIDITAIEVGKELNDKFGDPYAA